jgi:lysophospholipase L1-like esterase
VYAFGDSIVEGHRYPRSFVDVLAENQQMELTKYARNGATIGPDPPAMGGQILTQVQSASAAAPDFVVFTGGTNDAESIFERGEYEIGTLSSSHSPVDFGTGTYAGALEQTLHTMKQKWPTSQIVHITVHRLGSRDWATQLAIREVTLEAARTWKIAVADVFGTCTLDTRKQADRIKYTFDDLVDGLPGTNGSGTHPNLAGIVAFYVPVLTKTLEALAQYSTQNKS